MHNLPAPSRFIKRALSFFRTPHANTQARKHANTHANTHAHTRKTMSHPEPAVTGPAHTDAWGEKEKDGLGSISMDSKGDAADAADAPAPRADAELQRALRKVDRRLIPPLAILYLFSYLDRGSLANASIFGFKEDLGITTQQYNLIATVFFFTYGGMEVPGGIILSYVRPSLWIACICLAWGIVMTLSGLVQNFGGAIAVR